MALRLSRWDAEMPLPWPAVLEAVVAGVGGDGVEILDDVTMDDVLSPRFWGAGYPSVDVALWHWIDVAREHAGAMDEGAELGSPQAWLDRLWGAVAADVRWVLEAMPDELRCVHASRGDAPFWLVRALVDHTQARRAGSAAQTYLSRFIATAPTPLLRLAVTDKAGDTLLETVAEGRSLPEFLAGWLAVPRHIWRMVFRQAAVLPDMAPEDFAEVLQALRVIPQAQWPASRSAWNDLFGLATAIACDREVWDADLRYRHAILRTVWQQSPESGGFVYERLRGAAELLSGVADDQTAGLRGGSRLEVMWQLLNAGRLRAGPDAGPLDAGSPQPMLVSFGSGPDDEGTSLTLLSAVADVNAAGRQFENCLRSAAVAKGFLRTGTLLAVVAFDGAPAAMLALAASHAGGAGTIALEVLEVHGPANADVGAPMKRRIEALAARVGRRFRRPAH